MIVTGIPHSSGEAEGTSLLLEEPLSLWGGVDPATGEVIDRHHPQSGQFISGTVLIIPHGRGSSSGSGVLAECIRAGTAPAAIVMGELDPILMVGSLAAAELYPDRSCPLIEVGEEFGRLQSGVRTVVHEDGSVEQPG